MTAATPFLALNNGVQIPALGLGVYRSAPEDTSAAVTTALGHGYRLIDTAAAYDNEIQVGQAIAASGIDRAEVFVTTKLWITGYGHDAALEAFDASMGQLGLDTLDLYLLHQPLPSAFELTVAAYRAAEKLLEQGRVRAIGVSNFSIAQLESLMMRTEVVPAVNQVEVHPYFAQEPLRAFHTTHGILTQAWSPIGGVNRYWGDNAGRLGNPLADPVVVDLARKYGRTPAQVVLRWHLEHGFCAIPKSVRESRIAENIDLFDFQLTPGEIAAIDALDTGVRGGPNPQDITLASVRS